MIRTKLHILAENIDPATMQLGKDNEQVKDMLAAASYVVDNEVLDLLKREDARKSVIAIIQARLTYLPFSPMVVEFENIPQHREFVLLHQQERDTIIGRVCIMDNSSHAAAMATKDIKLSISDDGFVVNGYPVEWEETKVIVSSFMTGVCIALLMLNTKGIEKEIIRAPDALNKKRVSRGKPPVPHHSVVHIGTIYQRDGTAIKREGHGGWHMPVHWRCGYTRVQHYGTGWAEEKLVYIPPCLVNFKAEDDLPAAPKRNLRR